MTNVRCEQLRYTWAERRLDGRGAGFGVVVSSRNWPRSLLEQQGIRQLVTELSPAARRVPPESGAVFVTHRRLGSGSLLVAKRPVGTDGAGRPENYTVHALFDPTGTLGALDLDELVRAEAFRLARDIDIIPDGDAEPVDVFAVDRWQAPDPAAPDGRAGADGWVAGEPVRCWDLDELGAILRGLCSRMPADLVNQTDVDCGHDSPQTNGMVASSAIRSGTDFTDAVALGADKKTFWWARQGWDPADWTSTLDEFVIMNQPVGAVPDRWLARRWDRSTVRPRHRVVVELVDRSLLTSNPDLVREVAERPDLIDHIVDVGVGGNAKRRAAAAKWVATAGSDLQVVDLATELLVRRLETTVPPDLEQRLVQQAPDQLPPVLHGPVAAALDGSQPLSAEWRTVCLGQLLRGQPSCTNAAALVAAATDEEVAAALAAVAQEGADLDESWRQLGTLVNPSRRDRAFAGASEVTAAYLLERGLGHRARPGSPGQDDATDRVAQRAAARRLAAVWPGLAATLGWSDAVRSALPSTIRRERMLRLQRTILLAVVVALTAAVAVLATVR